MTRSRDGRNLRRLQTRIGPDEEGRRLDDVVAACLGTRLGRVCSRSAVRRMIMAGAVSVAGRPVRRPGLLLSLGAALELRVRPHALEAEGPTEPPSPAALRVLYEDDALLAVDKPAGVPTVPTADPRRPHLVGLVKEWLARREEGSSTTSEGEPYLGVHQRLDRDTSGVVLFARDRAANKGLAEAFAAHTVLKIYHAITRRPSSPPRGPWTVENRLGPAGRGKGPRIASVPSGGQVARTEFKVLAAGPGGLLVEARPRTGRKHQVRVHLSEASLPILGDRLYGGGGGVSRVMLHAARLAFVHPLSGHEIVIESPDPPDFVRVLEGRPARTTAARNPARRARRSSVR